jgi:hypothetical protein
MSTATPSRFGSLGDPSPLQLPTPGLYLDLEAGAGSVAMTDEFLEAAPAIRISVIQQWARALGNLRDAAIVEMFREFAEPLCELTIVEQIERFRQHCSKEGFNCPSDFAVLLQRF